MSLFIESSSKMFKISVYCYDFGNMIKEEQNRRCQKEWLYEFIDRLMWIQEEINRTCISKIKKRN